MNSDEKSSMKELEGWIEQLMECKQLSENQVLRDFLFLNEERFFKKFKWLEDN